MSENTAKLRIPKLIKHRNLGLVRFAGVDFYCGKWGEEDTQKKYQRYVAEYLMTGHAPRKQAREPQEMRVDEICLYFMEYLTGFDQKKFQRTKPIVKLAIDLYGDLPVSEFTPRRLKMLREAYASQINQGGQPRTRKETNRKTHLIQEMFLWAASEDMIPYPIAERLKAVTNLKAKDKTAARPSGQRVDAPRRVIRMVRRHLAPPLRCLIDLQMLTGARPSELLYLRAVDIDMSGPVWQVEFDDREEGEGLHHKTQHMGKKRYLHFGPKAQQILLPLIRNRPVTAYLFNAKEGADWHKKNGAKVGRRQNQKANTKSSDRVIRDHYDKDSYRRAVVRACEKVFPVPAHLKKKSSESAAEYRDRIGVEGRAELDKYLKAHRFTPYQLRHLASSKFRKMYDLEAARILLGHSDRYMTEQYGQEDQGRAVAVMKRSG